MRGIWRLLSALLALCLLFAPAGAFASGEPSAGSGEGTAPESETVTLVPEYRTELIIGPEGHTFTTDVYTARLEIDPAAAIAAPYPVVVFFGESGTVANGEVRGNVRFVSDYDEVIAIVHTNDIHGHLETEPYVKGLADALKASGRYSLVLTVSAGDVYGGGEAVAGSYNGEFIPAIMDRVYDLTVPGNNDYISPGVARQNLLLSHLYDRTVTLCANAAAKETGLALEEYAAGYEPVIGRELFAALYDRAALNPDGSLDLSALGLRDPVPGGAVYPRDAIFKTAGGTRIGLFGLTTNGGALSVELDSLGSVASAQKCVNELRAWGVDAVVGIGHTGWMGEGASGASSNDTNSWQLAASVDGLDAFIDGHTHSIINGGQGALVGDDPTFVNQAECFGSCIGVMFLYVKDGQVLAVDGEVLRDMSGITPDPEVQGLVDLALARVKEDFGRPIAHTDYFLNGERMSAGNEGGSVRGNETNLGDLMTDVIRAAASEKLGAAFDFCAYPGFWLRASVEAGDITLESLQGIFANPTILYWDIYTGEQILGMVKRGLSSVYPEKEDTTFTQYSGIRVVYTDNAGTGTPVAIWVGDTLVYDAAGGGLQVEESWTCLGVLAMTGGEIDNYTGDGANFICGDKEAVQELVGGWFQSHGPEDYTVYPNTVAPAGRIVQAG